MKKPSKIECDKYILRKYGPTGAEMKPKNLSYELEDGCEFVYIETIGKKKGITIKCK